LLPDLRGGGAERVALASIRDLIEHDHEVDLLLIHGGGELLPLLPPDVRVIEFRRRRLSGGLLPLARYLRKVRPDALHAVMWPTTVIALMAHKLAGSKARLMVSDHAALSRHMKSRGEEWLLRWSTRLLYPRADFRIVVSVAAADDLARVSGLPRQCFEVIYNPIEPPPEIESTPEIEELWGDAGQRIITVGSLKEQKNHALLLRAFAQLVPKRPSAKLMILGEGAVRPQLEALARDLGIADRLVMPGFALDPWPYLASASLFVLSSDYEGFPLVLAEAMYAGLPLVSTDCLSGPAELLDGGRFGRLVPCGDSDALAAAMDRALDEPKDADRQRERAVEMAGPHTLARYSEILLAD
jgi:glycosyltransferase involved in cell wall biosynthesis